MGASRASRDAVSLGRADRGRVRCSLGAAGRSGGRRRRLVRRGSGALSRCCWVCRCCWVRRWRDPIRLVPLRRSLASARYRPSSGRVPRPPALVSPPALVLFGGSSTSRYPGGDTNTPIGDSWTFDGTTWTELSVPGPPARYGHSMATLGASPTGRVVLFGGLVQMGSLGEVGEDNDTWVFDGSAWTEVAVAGPTPRDSAMMASLGNAIVLFGGTIYGGTIGLRRHLGVRRHDVDRSHGPRAPCPLLGHHDEPRERRPPVRRRRQRHAGPVVHRRVAIRRRDLDADRRRCREPSACARRRCHGHPGHRHRGALGRARHRPVPHRLSRRHVALRPGSVDGGGHRHERGASVPRLPRLGVALRLPRALRV